MLKLFLDSGAFSAMTTVQKEIKKAFQEGRPPDETKFAKIDIDQYIADIHKWKEWGIIGEVACLDVIGDPVKSYENQKYMESKGVTAIPVYHLIDMSPKWLEKLVDEYDYIAIGGMAGVPGMTVQSVQDTMDELFMKVICDKNGYPKVKVHAFGCTSLRLMLRYPWYSVDSISWVVTGRMGSIFVPKGSDYTKEPWKIAVSARSSSKGHHDKHFSTLSQDGQIRTLEYIKSKGYVMGVSKFRDVPVDKNGKGYEAKENERWFGETKKVQGKDKYFRVIEEIIVPGLCNDYQLRDEINILYFTDLERNYPSWPWQFSLKKKTKGEQKRIEGL